MVENAANRLQRLEDAEAIRNLIASYGLLADSGDAEGVAALWLADGRYDVGGFGIAHGHEEIAGLIRSETHQELMEDGCAHILTTPHIVLDGAEAIATNHSVVFRRNGDTFEAWRVSANRWELACTDDEWCISLRVNRPLGGSEAARALLNLRADRHPR